MQARARFKEGVEFYDKGQYENARLAFLQAYALKKHPAVLLNLAQSSAKAGPSARGREVLPAVPQGVDDRDPAAARRRRERPRRGPAEARAHRGRRAGRHRDHARREGAPRHGSVRRAGRRRARRAQPRVAERDGDASPPTPDRRSRRGSAAACSPSRRSPSPAPRPTTPASGALPRRRHGAATPRLRGATRAAEAHEPALAAREHDARLRRPRRRGRRSRRRDRLRGLQGRRAVEGRHGRERDPRRREQARHQQRRASAASTNAAIQKDFGSACTTLKQNNDKVDTNATIANVSLVVMGVGARSRPSAGTSSRRSATISARPTGASKPAAPVLTPYAGYGNGGFILSGSF